MRFPDFFIVGAPKCGTTALAYYLRQHPEIFMPEGEIHFLSLDFPIERAIRTWDEYITIFSHAPSGTIVGEKSVSYLYSEEAASQIKRHNPNARIIIILRNPIEMMYSLYLHLLRDGVEVATDFERALALEEERLRGRSIPKGTPGLGFLFYRHLASYHRHLERYMRLFPKENLIVLIYEEFFKDVQSNYKDILEFLGVNTSFSPINFQRVNVAKSVSNPRGYVILSALLIRMPIMILGSSRRILPEPVRKQLRKFRSMILRSFTGESKKDVPDHIRCELEREFFREAEILSNMLGKDLTKVWFRNEVSKR